MALRYAVRNLEKARAYLAHPILGPREECAQAVLDVPGKSALEIPVRPTTLSCGPVPRCFGRSPDRVIDFRPSSTASSVETGLQDPGTVETGASE